MRRLSNEDGREASARNWGRLALGLIPLALALGASTWLGFYIGVHKFNRQLSQEDRAAIAVGAWERPKSRIVIDRQSGQKFCAGVTRADVDGETIRLYATNDCGKTLTDMAYHWEALSPNGTIIESSSHSAGWCSTPRLPKDSAECVFDGHYGLPSDDRLATVRVWTVPYSDK